MENTSRNDPGVTMPCRICGSTGPHATVDARERMFGIGDVHRYVACTDCGCLQIERVPADIARYYGPSYYSFKAASERGVRGAIAARRNRYAVLGSGALGRLLFGLRPTRLFDFLGPARSALRLDSSILDVGCGAGELVRTLRQAGFRRARGVDPYIGANIELEGRPLVTRATLDQVDDRHDLIMFHHSLEHMPEQLQTLRRAEERLRPGGHCIVRVPLSSSLAWERYGVDWVQLDAPRHFYLHTVDSMRRLAAQAGLRCIAVNFDSTGFQFWGSEQYAAGISLVDPRSYAVDPAASMFGADDIARFDREADALNAAERGDQAGFVLRRASERPGDAA